MSDMNINMNIKMESVNGSLKNRDFWSIEEHMGIF